MALPAVHLLLAAVLATPLVAGTQAAGQDCAAAGVIGGAACSVPNGSFERCGGCVPETSGTPDGWTNAFNTAGAGEATWMLRDQSSGAASLRLDCTGAFYLRTASFAVTPNANYTLRAAVRSPHPFAPVAVDGVAPEDGHVTHGVDFFDAAGALVGRRYAGGYTGDAWSQGGFLGTTPATAATAQAFVGCTTAGSALVDDVRLEYA